MKLATVEHRGDILAGVVREGDFTAFRDLDPGLPDDLLSYIDREDTLRPLVEAALATTPATASLGDVRLLAPLPNPRTIRDFVGFEEHAANSGKRFGMDLTDTLEVWRKAPAFYFSNTNNVSGQDEPVPAHPRSQMFDFEFEVGFVIGRGGRDIAVEDAADHIFGFTVFTDWSARDIQVEEMKLGAGAPLGKGYANTFGPVIVTRDEFDAHLDPSDPLRYDAKTTLTLNGEVLRENNLNTIHYSFAEMVAWASRDTDLVVGDIFGSGTVGGGALVEYPMELGWITSGDVIEMTVDGIGTLVNTVK